MRGLLAQVLLALMTSLLAGGAQAHEFRTTFLVVEARDSLNYDLSWRLSIKDANSAGADWAPGPGCALALLGTSRGGSVEQREYALSCASGPPKVFAPMLEGVPFDVLVEIKGADGHSRFEHLNASRHELTIASGAPADGGRNSMLVEGIVHVLGGLDHLAYIVLLFLFLRHRRSDLILGVTLFTLAHSLTLALSAVGVLQVPAAPVEAVIALTIAYFASAVARGNHAGSQSEARAWPAIVVICGLIHGLGFANSLSEIGLGDRNLALSLVSFNIGIELAQLALVALMEAALLGLRAMSRRDAFRIGEHAVAVGIGALSVFWYLDRLL